MKTTISAGLAMAALTLLPSPTSPAAAQGQATCRGQEATHVGERFGNIRGTNGADVIVTNGADRVAARRGDDIICVTGTHGPAITPGRGDDVVDARRFAGRVVYTEIRNGHRVAHDVYVGGPHRDVVSVSNEPDTGGSLTMVGGDGRDELVASTYSGRIEARLGLGDDELDIRRRTTRANVDAGPGTDNIVGVCNGCRLEVRLGRRGDFAYGDDHGRASNFENVTIHVGRQPRGVIVEGSARPNRIVVGGCRATALGHRGADRIAALGGAENSDCDGERDGERGWSVQGGPGGDLITGTTGRDVLLGGGGADEARGYEGEDVCRAEVRRGCEL
jgi:Ca2+-binding RTX toxin-like protein